ncbi:MAG: transcription elongation factor Spt5 [Candidatus Woesearchaeota archaeon]
MEEEKKEQIPEPPVPEDENEQLEENISDESIKLDKTEEDENINDEKLNETENLNSDKLDEINKEIKEEEKEIKKIDQELEQIDNEIEEEEKQDNQLDESNSTNNKEDNPKKDTNYDDISDIDETQALINELKEEKIEEVKEEIKEEVKEVGELKTSLFALRTTANREDQVMDFLTSNAEKKKFKVYSIIRPHGMRGYIFVEAESKSEAEQAAFGVPYARGLLPNEIQYSEIEHMLEQVKREVNIQQNDIVEIISGPFKRENAKIIRIDKTKEEVVVELLEAAVPIPITLKLDAVKVIRRDTEDKNASDD